MAGIRYKKKQHLIKKKENSEVPMSTQHNIENSKHTRKKLIFRIKLKKAIEHIFN
jgi:hypothetical protein